LSPPSARRTRGSDLSISGLSESQALSEAIDELTSLLDTIRNSRQASGPSRRALLLRMAGALQLSEDSESKTLVSRRLNDFKKALVAEAGLVGLSPAETRDFFRKVTSTGTFPESDAYFKASVLAHLASAPPGTLEELLGERLFYGRALQAELARQVLAPKIAALKKRPVKNQDVLFLVEKLEALMPDRSVHRDTILEKRSAVNTRG
jgi:hypothetical protein